MVSALQHVVDKYGLYLQHLQTMSEESSFKAADCMKFQGWLRKWQQAMMLILPCLFIQLLSPAQPSPAQPSPAKALSLAFQGEEIDIVSSVVHIQTRNEQVEPLQRRDLQDLPT